VSDKLAIKRAADTLTPKKLAFAKAHVQLGGQNATKAAIMAGYSSKGGGAGAAVTASRLLRDPRVLQAIKEETERSLRAGVAMAANTLTELAQNAQSESVRLQASQALLDRGGMQLATLSQHHVLVEDKRTDDELRARVEQLQRELGLSAKVIPAEIVPPRALPMETSNTPDDVAAEIWK
jgi:phage terminase small subunit